MLGKKVNLSIYKNIFINIKKIASRKSNKINRESVGQNVPIRKTINLVFVVAFAVKFTNN